MANLASRPDLDKSAETSKGNEGVQLGPPEQAPGATDICDSGPAFDPPLYVQRYQQVADVVEREGCTSVIDFGCSSCKFMRYLKNIPSLQSITGVDVDAGVLKANTYFITPLTTDYLDPREKPLTMRLYCGSLADCDLRVKGCEAVTMIEVIEHLDVKTLDVFPQTVFVFIRPLLVVITTPNAEFNKLFPGDTGGFRHWDHKFEWSRRQFQEWCSNVALKYSYSVEYTGVGESWSPEAGDVGHCTQTAVFRRLATCAKTSDVQGGEVYELIAEREHPYQKSPLSLKQKTYLEVDYMVRNLCREFQNSNYNDCQYDDHTTDPLMNGRCHGNGEGDSIYNTSDKSSHEMTASWRTGNEHHTSSLREPIDGNDTGVNNTRVLSSGDAGKNQSFRNFGFGCLCDAQSRMQLSRFEEGENTDVQKSNELKVTVPLERLISCRRIKNLCGDLDTLRSLLLESDTYVLNHDLSAIVVTIDNDSDSLTTDSDNNSTSGQFSDAEEDITTTRLALEDMAEESWD